MRICLCLILIIYSGFTLFLSNNAISETLEEFHRIQRSPNPLNDYFSKDPRVKGLLANVEEHHFNKLPYFKNEPGFSIKNVLVHNNSHAFYELKYVLDRFPNHPKALEIMGDLSRMMENDLLGMYYYGRAINLYPQYAITHYQYGLFLMDIGKIDESIDEFQKTIDIEPGFAASYHMLSIAHKKKGEPELAQEFGKKAESLGYKVTNSDNSAVGK